MERCKDCRYFDTTGTVIKSIRKEGWGSCLIAEMDLVQPHLNAASLAQAHCIETGHSEAWLYVSPDYGCVQFERG
jgi:hypothetical protein